MQTERKLRVAILFGGKSAEHEVSLQSAKNVLNAIDKSRFEPILIGIDKQGAWHLNDAAHFLANGDNPQFVALNKPDATLSLMPGTNSEQIVTPNQAETIGNIDVVFPVLHGPYGEDGSMQGLLKLLNIPFVGSGVLGSALGMDKIVMKKLLRDATIPIARFLSFSDHQKDKIHFQELAEQLGLPLFIKPANLGSSVGVSKISDESEFLIAIDEAFSYDRKVLIEENITGREIECAVLGNENPEASVPGEVICNPHTNGFYSYEAKYIDENGAVLEIPANLTKTERLNIQELAIKSYETLCCEGMARVDFFLKPNGEVVVNELNTIPGFTSISMYPKLWEATGKSYSELISDLIDLALQRFEAEKKLRTSVIISSKM